ncbi:MFS transporter [Paraburkholderia ginsengiterrae]|uniref:MFS transporter n=1 Tax=Paraburkholderia ginsengiterrae TaxID=1462993 RepID=A0A1A9N337_9BURK|nr:MFS transporter [Paraburkholderia ginsengiterrae]OAJ55989.1 MFS transporter [Paraburkholderia ginsengiterrae]OAJ58615.1 MFS transporter [Paraburkholderia ginsengiterrae]
MTEVARTYGMESTKKAGASHRRVALASLIGTAVEWYDYYIYGVCAALLFPKLFFPSVSPLIGTIAAFATYAVGFAARPIGAAVFGHYGDRIGRKSMLVVSLLMMGGSTVAIGVLPTFATAGLLAPILLCLLRIIQGFAVGGEWGSAVVMAVEHAPENRRGLFGSFPQIGTPLGLLLSTGVFALVSSSLDEATLLAWGWRIPFLASTAMIAIGMFIRMNVHESPVFEEIKRKQEAVSAPALEVVKAHRKTLLITIGMKMLQNAVFYLYSVFMLSFIVGSLKVERSVGLNAILISSCIGIATIPLWSYLSDLIGRKKVYLTGTILSTIFIIPFFMMVETRNVYLITIAIIIGLNILHDSMYGPQAVYFSELFGTKVRLSGANIGYAIGAVLSGGLAPMIATYLLAVNDGKTWGISLYVIGLGVISIVATAFARETFKDGLHRN